MSSPRNQRALRINPAPFKPSFLSIPPSPCSPRAPLTPVPAPISHRTTAQHLGTYSLPASDAPPTPLSWMWTCHQCHRNYHLGVTRRCLEDGHIFCSGTTTVKAWRKPNGTRRVRRHRACASEFDYQGWKVWGRWRRGGATAYKGSASSKKKDCWNTCDYPSECRWGKKFGVHTPVDAVCPVLETQVNVPVLTAPVEGVLKPENCKAARTSTEDAEKTTFWGALIASAERRKSGSASSHASSPLATVMEEELEDLSVENTSPSLQDHDGDVLMTTIDPSLLTKHNDLPSPTYSASSLSVPSSSSTTSTAAAAASAAADSLKALISRKRVRRSRSSRSNSHSSERRYADPLLVVPKPVVLRRDEEAGFVHAEAMLEGFAPLERVASRDSGYHSTVNVMGM